MIETKQVPNLYIMDGGNTPYLCKKHVINKDRNSRVYRMEHYENPRDIQETCVLCENCVYVTVYECNRACYSSAEGGCWYDYGEPIVDPRNKCFENIFNAQQYKEKLQQDLDENDNFGRPNIDSVICRGVYSAYLDVNSFPKSFPEQTPTYG